MTTKLKGKQTIMSIPVIAYFEAMKAEVARRDELDDDLVSLWARSLSGMEKELLKAYETTKARFDEQVPKDVEFLIQEAKKEFDESILKN